MKTRRITITVDDEVNDFGAIRRCMEVVDKGYLSKNGTAYCLCTVFNSGVVVLADKTRTGNLSFKVYKENSNGQ